MAEEILHLPLTPIPHPLVPILDDPPENCPCSEEDEECE